MANEPIQLRRGKAFHNEMQADWLKTAEGLVSKEKAITKPTGRKGRIDIFVDDDDPNSTVAIVEVKATDWDKIAPKNIQRNVRRQIRQIWSYIESQILNGKHVEGSEGKDVCPGVIFPKRPKDKERMKLIEKMFEEEGIPVVWHDETKEERKARS